MRPRRRDKTVAKRLEVASYAVFSNECTMKTHAI
jgi:hypothetical protein